MSPTNNPEHKITQKKERLVDEILENTTYLPEAGIRLRLRRVLLKLSLADLDSLVTILKCKE